MASETIADLAGQASRRFAAAKFRPPSLPGTLVTRQRLLDRLTAGVGQRLTLVAGSAGSGKSVLLASWTATRPRAATSWLSCDDADANPVRFWAGFVEATRTIAPDFGADADSLLSTDGVVTADVTASIANDAARLPAGSAIVVDDFHHASAAVCASMTELVECWPAETTHLILTSRLDPAVRLQRLRMSGQLCELRDADLGFSLGECRELFANLAVEVDPASLAEIYQRTEGWAAAVQMAALSLRDTSDAAQLARALDVRGQPIAEYFVGEVLDRQPTGIVRFMLDTSILDDLTADACAAVTGRPDSEAMLRRVRAAHLFVVALDDEQGRFRYHPLIRRVLRAELRARDRDRYRQLQRKAADWLELAGDARRAARHFLAAGEADRALALLQDRVVTDFVKDPAMPAPLELGEIDPALLAAAPERLLGLAADLLLSGDVTRGTEYLGLAERGPLAIEPGSRLAGRLAAARAFRHWLLGQPAEAVREVLAARASADAAGSTDEWVSAAVVVLLRGYTDLGDYAAVEHEAAAVGRADEIGAPVRLVAVPGARALALFERGDLAAAAEVARAADRDAVRLGFARHVFGVDGQRTLAGLALESGDLEVAERLTEQNVAASDGTGPAPEFLALLDQAAVRAAGGHVRGALEAVATARAVLAGASADSVLLARADELEAVLRLSLGDLRSPAELAGSLPPMPRNLLLARVALAAGDHQAARGQLADSVPGSLTPRQALLRQTLLTAAAVMAGEPAVAALVAELLDTARRLGFCYTLVASAPQLAGYLVEHSTQVRPDPFLARLIAVALRVRSAQPATARPGARLPEPLTDAEMRVLKLLPTSTYVQMADTLYISRNTVKTHLRSIYHKLLVASRSEAIERAVDLRLLLATGTRRGSVSRRAAPASGS